MNNEKILKIGDSGDDVTLLQSLLKINDFFPQIITGVYGPDTSHFVSKFQNKYNINEEGYTGYYTFEKLYNLTIDNNFVGNVLEYPTIKLGDTDPYVYKLKSILTEMEYYNGEINNYFSDDLDTCVKIYQLVNKLVTDGIVGTLTWSSLINIYTPLSLCSDNDVPQEDPDYYIVVSGDTLYSIANKFNTSVSHLMELNNLSNTALTIGQKLLINNLSNDSSTYTVVAGDTLYSIASKYNTSVSVLKELNNLTSDILTIGQTLIINVPTDNYSTYIVVSGDTLYSIASKYNTSVSDLISINGLTSSNLYIGQKIKVPSSLENYYTIVAGDTLYSISNKFNTSVSKIMEDNKLSDTNLYIGQQLKI
ncbi:MAG: LysM peptidoglycan-binding domain-containing protein [bacterium]